MNDVFIRFIGDESTYINCNEIFLSKIALYRYSKKYTYYHNLTLLLDTTITPINIM